MEGDKKFTIEDYQELLETVVKYQGGCQEAGQKIITQFQDFLGRYIMLLLYGVVQMESPSIRRFLGLYMSDAAVRKTIHQYNHNPSASNALQSTGRYLQSLLRKLDAQDIEQILTLTLLTMASRYKNYDRPSFHTYVDRCFHFTLYRALKSATTDTADRLSADRGITSFKGSSSMDADTGALDIFGVLHEDDGAYDRVINEVDHRNRLDDATAFITTDKTSVYDDECLNLNWINGITATDIFKGLTPFERRILVLSYVEKWRDSDIADELGLCRATINRRKQRAKQKVMEAYQAHKDKTTVVIA